MKNVFKVFIVLFIFFSLTGCGLKGSFYFSFVDKNVSSSIKSVET